MIKMVKKYSAIYTYIVIVFIAIILSSCKENDSTFSLVSQRKSGIDFNNLITESDSFNILTYEYIYNGGGVAIADFNNDGLADIYFTGNMVENALYLNKGGMDFIDVTNESNASGANKWCSGVAVVDINNDGWKDIYICATTHVEDARRENILYIHQGLNENGIPVFKDMAKQYGLADSGHSTNAVFFDYDNDGDLDMYLVTNKMVDSKTPNTYKKLNRVSKEKTDRLFRNDWNDELNHPVFVNVSEEAGIVYEGYGLGVNIADINKDGWKDIYVTNDFLTADLMYVNNGDGTFREMSKQFFKHTSHAAMGNDIVDINNNGHLDLIAVDMMPEDNFRKKTMVPPYNYTSYINNEKYGYQYQYMRNTLQVNHGFETKEGAMAFSEVGILAGISSTDWSWSPLAADFDNDGLRDLIITNGFPKDITDRDFIEYNNEVGQYASKRNLLSKIPTVKIKNYAYKNLGNNTFEDVTELWGMGVPSFSNGAAYGDLDNDGDLDYVVNNINDNAFIFENLTNNRKGPAGSWLKIKLKGDKNNLSGLGAIIKVYHRGEVLYWDHNIYRGYLSTMDDNIHFGLRKSDKIDSLLVFWPQGQLQKLFGIDVNQTIEIDIKDARETGSVAMDKNLTPLFNDVSDKFLSYKHKEDDYIDFNVQHLLPHKLSQYGPGLAIGDVNGDGLEDIFIGGSHFYKGSFFIQNKDKSFALADLLPGADGDDKKEEDLGVLLFDADGDGDQDLYIVSGGYEFGIDEDYYKDRFYENIEGVFVHKPSALPDFQLSGSFVKGADFDRDGDIDLFIGGRVMPHQYPKPVSSLILENKSTSNHIQFEIVNEKVAPELNNFGMVCDALWTDFNNDGWVDLIVAGEWMPLRFFINEKGKLSEITYETGIADKVGWWNSLVSGDFDNDGDVDYIAGNLGLNTFFKVNDQTPFSVYAADFDGNKGFDIIPTAFYKNTDGKLEEYPIFGRLDLQKQIIKVKADFLKHTDFGKATIKDILNREQLDSALTYRANYMYSSYIENLGNNKFKIHPLPIDCQMAPVYGMQADDFDDDGNLDVLLTGNDFGTELITGRFDALNGIMLAGDGKGGFKSTKLQESGFYVPGDAKALASLVNDSGEQLIIGTQNRDHLKVYSFDRGGSGVVRLSANDFLVEFIFPDGSRRKKEVYYGDTFLSQSSRKVIVPGNVSSIEITNFKGEKRTLKVGLD